MMFFDVADNLSRGCNLRHFSEAVASLPRCRVEPVMMEQV